MLAAGAPLGGEDLERRMLTPRTPSSIVPVACRYASASTGRVFASDFGPSFRRTYSIKGDAINVAARVMGKSSPGQVLAVRDVVSRAGGDRGNGGAALPRQGKSHPIQTALVTATGDNLRTLASGTAGLHGRDHEIGIPPPLSATPATARAVGSSWWPMPAWASPRSSAGCATRCPTSPSCAARVGASAARAPTRHPAPRPGRHRRQPGRRARSSRPPC